MAMEKMIHTHTTPACTTWCKKNGKFVAGLAGLEAAHQIMFSLVHACLVWHCCASVGAILKIYISQGSVAG